MCGGPTSACRTSLVVYTAIFTSPNSSVILLVNRDERCAAFALFCGTRRMSLPLAATEGRAGRAVSLVPVLCAQQRRGVGGAQDPEDLATTMRSPPIRQRIGLIRTNPRTSRMTAKNDHVVHGSRRDWPRPCC